MLLPIYSVYLTLVSIISYCLYASDKSKAKRGQWRIPEKVLLGFSFFGGAIGGYLGMKIFRHKTKHWYFHAHNLLGIAWQVSLLAYLILLEL